jgi:hypothetical protein
MLGLSMKMKAKDGSRELAYRKQHTINNPSEDIHKMSANDD